MMMRLAFSVAIHMDPEVLLVDEVLAVGDAGFQEKCFDRIREFRHAGKTLLCRIAFRRDGAGDVRSRHLAGPR